MPTAIYNVDDWRKPSRRLIFPLAGKMSDRTEGGATECAVYLALGGRESKNFGLALAKP